MDLESSYPLTKTLNCVRKRGASLRLYLNDPSVAIDTNHLERTLRVTPMGRKSWLFCWTEIGPSRSLLSRLCWPPVGCAPSIRRPNLSDMLQRISQHNAHALCCHQSLGSRRDHPLAQQPHVARQRLPGQRRHRVGVRGYVGPTGAICLDEPVTDLTRCRKDGGRMVQQ
jgi:hypothetical protein